MRCCAAEHGRAACEPTAAGECLHARRAEPVAPSAKPAVGSHAAPPCSAARHRTACFGHVCALPWRPLCDDLALAGLSATPEEGRVHGFAIYAVSVVAEDWVVLIVTA